MTAQRICDRDNPLHPSYPLIAKKQDHFGPQQQGPNNAAKSQVSLEFPRLFRDIFWASSQWGDLKIDSSESKVTYFQRSSWQWYQDPFMKYL